MVKPYYQEDGITIWHSVCEEILPIEDRADLLLTDPPYGINQANGIGGGGYEGFGKGIKRSPKGYVGSWDDLRPTRELLALALSRSQGAIIWGGNYFSTALPFGKKWLVWDKEQTMPTYSDAELAWTNLDGNSVKMFRQCGAGLMAVEKIRFHPTQKPMGLMKWCLSLFPDTKSVLDPFCGSGTTLVAAKDMGLTAVGIEAEERYCEIAANRLRQSVLKLHITKENQ